MADACTRDEILYCADLDALCPRCLNKIEFVTEKEYLKKCKPKKLNHVNLASKFCYYIYFYCFHYLLTLSQ